MSLSVAIRHQYPEFSLDASFDVGAGLTAVMGRSGAGKTTVANAVAGLFRPDEGKVLVAGETLLDTSASVDVPAHRRRIGYVFQEARLFPH
jgi:molybdate transport system ATP-binding protein